MFCDDLEEGDGRREGEDICIIMADSRCTTENNTTL